MYMGVNFGLERTILDIKHIFLKVKPTCGGKDPNLISQILWYELSSNYNYSSEILFQSNDLDRNYRIFEIRA